MPRARSVNRARKQVYSVPIGEPGSMRCCEWRWPSGAAKWTQSERDGSSWLLDGELREEGRQALLAHFSLSRFADRLPLAELGTMPPRELHRLSVELARESGMEPPEPPRSDRVGAHIPASLAA